MEIETRFPALHWPALVVKHFDIGGVNNSLQNEKKNVFISFSN